MYLFGTALHSPLHTEACVGSGGHPERAQRRNKKGGHICPPV